MNKKQYYHHLLNGQRFRRINPYGELSPSVDVCVYDLPTNVIQMIANSPFTEWDLVQSFHEFSVPHVQDYLKEAVNFEIHFDGRSGKHLISTMWDCVQGKEDVYTLDKDINNMSWRELKKLYQRCCKLRYAAEIIKQEFIYHVENEIET